MRLKKYYLGLLTLIFILTITRSCWASEQIIILQAEKATYDQAGNAVCKLNLIQDGRPLVLAEHEVSGAFCKYAQRTGPSENRKYLFTESKIPVQTDANGTFVTVKVATGSFCQAYIFFKKDGINYTAEAYLSLYGQAPAGENQILATEKNNFKLPFFSSKQNSYLQTGQKLTMNYRSLGSQPLEVMVYEDKLLTAKRLKIDEKGNFEYQKEQSPAMTVDKDKRFHPVYFFVQEQVTGQKYLSTLNFEVVEAYYGYINLAQGLGIFFSTSLAAAVFIAWRRRKLNNVSK